MLNFLALMGWSYGDDIELFSVEQMMRKFSFKGFNLGGPVFDVQKLHWINRHYLKELEEEEFVEHLQQEVFSADYLRKIRPLCIERMDAFDKFVDNNSFFFNGSLDYSTELLVPKKRSPGDMLSMFQELVEVFDEIDIWKVAELTKALEELAAKLGWKPRDYFMPLRIALTGRKDSPPLLESVEVLGREIVRFRLREAIARLEALHSEAEKPS